VVEGMPEGARVDEFEPRVLGKVCKNRYHVGLVHVSGSHGILYNFTHLFRSVLSTR
jgi:hypothetical protein